MGVPDIGSHFACHPKQARAIMKNFKFVVKVSRAGILAAQYVKRIDRTPIEMTTDRKLALVMGKFTAEDAAKSIFNARCNPELVRVQISA
jgi:hypothetical protein